MFIMSMLLPLVCLLQLGMSLERGIFEPGIIITPGEDITDSFQRTDFGVTERNWGRVYGETHPVMILETAERRKGCSSAISTLEIIKSVELEFDPKTGVFVPVTETPRQNQAEEEELRAYQSALMLLGSKTHRQLKKVFDSWDVEGKNNGSRIRTQKKFQTGRFKTKV